MRRVFLQMDSQMLFAFNWRQLVEVVLEDFRG